mmetsp:Transcript_11366/g.47350  ORF Transcript_11366/g.47350 Transcript_11366/m.47350 type:complete len:96 (-) Transcript_11366:2098-2385(-)
MNWQLRPGWIGFLFDGRVFGLGASRRFMRTTTYCTSSGSNGTGGLQKASTDDGVVVQNMPSLVNQSSNERYLGIDACQTSCRSSRLRLKLDRRRT